MEEGVVPHTAHTRKDAGTGEGLTIIGLAELGEKWISLTGDSGSYSLSVMSGQGLDILSGRLVPLNSSSSLVCKECWTLFGR